MTCYRALDLYCGAGGASRGLVDAGFDVFGIDIAPQPHYPYQFAQRDVLTLTADDLRGFDLIWASPPCQAFSSMRYIDPTKQYADLIPFTRALLAAHPCTIIENVPRAPIRPDIVLCGVMFGLRIKRHRWFELSWPVLSPMHACQRGHAGTHRRRGPVPTLATADYLTIAGYNYAVADGRIAMGIDWMPGRSLNQAVPPAYARYLGGLALAHRAENVSK